MNIECERFVRKKVTGRYLGGDGLWCLAAQARHFPNIGELIDFCASQIIPEHLQLVLRPAVPDAGDVVVDLF